MKTERVKGQGLIEVVFGVGVLVMIITAVASLVVKTTNIKTEMAQRKKASEMSEVVVENLLDIKNNDPDNFWQLNDIISPQIISGYDDYQYMIDFNWVSEGNCSDTVVECADAIITITWGDNQTFIAKRFFTRN